MFIFMFTSIVNTSAEVSNDVVNFHFLYLYNRGLLLGRAIDSTVMNSTLPPAGAPIEYLFVILASLAWTAIATVGRKAINGIGCVHCLLTPQLNRTQEKKEEKKGYLMGISTRDE